MISDTPMYKKGERYIAFEPVVRELEVLIPLFEEIVWLGCRANRGKYAMRSPADHLPIKIIVMPGVLSKYNLLRMFLLYPVFAYYLLKYVGGATHVHTRGPSHPALLGILFSIFLRKRLYWHKYAGNWIGEKLSATYQLQKRLLKLAGDSKVKVTVNGLWSDNPKHILSFENPCLSEEELRYATAKAAIKDFSGKLNIVFVGNLTKAKGVLSLVEAATGGQLSERFENLYIAGDGDLRGEIVNQIAVKGKGPHVHLLGHQDRRALNKLYEACHIIILPSESEGFPKVIAEGAAFGCVPVVTDVSALSQYIQHGKNGFLLSNNSGQQIIATLNATADNPMIRTISAEASLMAAAFTYERFVSRLQKEVFDFEQQD